MQREVVSRQLPLKAKKDKTRRHIASPTTHTPAQRTHGVGGITVSAADADAAAATASRSIDHSTTVCRQVGLRMEQQTRRLYNPLRCDIN